MGAEQSFYDGKEFEGQMKFDIGNLAAFVVDPNLNATLLQQQHKLNVSQDNGQYQVNAVNNAFLDRAQRQTQCLINKIFQLERESNDAGIFALLPQPTINLPREKPLPKSKPLTKWQKFAKDKGITKSKRSKNVWDEHNQEYRRRYGFKSKYREEDVPVIEAGPNAKVGEDPFEKLDEERRSRHKDQGAREQKNMEQHQKDGHIPYSVQLANQQQIRKHHTIKQGREAKPAIDYSRAQANYATASTGKKGAFVDKNLKNMPGQKRKFQPMIDKEEQGRMGSFVDKYLRSQADDIIDYDAAITNVESQKRQKRQQVNQSNQIDKDDQNQSKDQQTKTKFEGKGGPSKGGQVKSKGSQFLKNKGIQKQNNKGMKNKNNKGMKNQSSKGMQASNKKANNFRNQKGGNQPKYQKKR